VIALEEEFSELFNEIKHRYQSFPDGDTGRQHYLFEQSSEDGSYLYRCVATFVGEMGSMLSGLVTHRLIERWQPETLVMLGIAAAMNKDVYIGDVVVAKQIDSYFDSSKAIPDLDPNKFTFAFSGEVYRSSSDLLNATRNFKFVHGEIFQDWQHHCQSELEQLIPQVQREQLIAHKLLRDQVQAVTGDIASGPTVGAAQAFIDWLKKRNRKYAALEMEAAGFMAAIHEETSAKRTLVLRAISDYGDERKRDLDEVEEGAFRRYAMRNAIQLLWRFLDVGIPPTNLPAKKA
jgi:nucleoside phosphorylase